MKDPEECLLSMLGSLLFDDNMGSTEHRKVAMHALVFLWEWIHGRMGKGDPGDDAPLEVKLAALYGRGQLPWRGPEDTDVSVANSSSVQSHVH